MKARKPLPLMVRVEAGRLSASDLEHPDLQPLLLPRDRFDGEGSRLPGAVIKNPGGGKQRNWAACRVVNRKAKYTAASGEVPTPPISCRHHVPHHLPPQRRLTTAHHHRLTATIAHHTIAHHFTLTAAHCPSMQASAGWSYLREACDDWNWREGLLPIHSGRTALTKAQTQAALTVLEGLSLSRNARAEPLSQLSNSSAQAAANVLMQFLPAEPPEATPADPGAFFKHSNQRTAQTTQADRVEPSMVEQQLGKIEAGRLSASDLEHPDLQPLLLPLDRFEGEGSRLPGAVVKNPGGGKQKHWATCWVVDRKATYTTASGEVRQLSPPHHRTTLPTRCLTRPPRRSPPPLTTTAHHRGSPPWLTTTIARHHSSPPPLILHRLPHKFRQQQPLRSFGMPTQAVGLEESLATHPQWSNGTHHSPGGGGAHSA